MTAGPHHWINRLGAVTTICLVLNTILSFGLAPTAPWSTSEPNEANFFAELGDGLSFLGDPVRDFIAGESFLARPGSWLLAFALPKLLATAVFGILILLLARYQHLLTATSARHLLRWTFVFAVVNVPAVPVYFQDFWVSIVWGRMVASGLNPYYSDWIPSLFQDLPLDYLDWRMTYGPVWALTSGQVGLFAGWHWLPAALFFKALLAGAWIGSLSLIRHLLRNRSVWHQSVGIVVFGWLPFSVTQTVADGHNDIFLVLPMLLWIALTEAGSRPGASLALVTSVLVKYTTAPLFLLDLLWQRCLEKRTWFRVISNALLALACALVLMALFFRSLEFFEPLLVMRRVHFFSPRSAALRASELIGLESEVFVVAASILFPAISIAYLGQFVSRPNSEHFRKAVLGVLCATVFTGMSYIWPWYLTWPLSVAALVPSFWLGRWILGASIAFTFVIPIAPIFFSYSDVGIPLYLAALFCMLLLPSRLFPQAYGDRDSPTETH